MRIAYLKELSEKVCPSRLLEHGLTKTQLAGLHLIAFGGTRQIHRGTFNWLLQRGYVDSEGKPTQQAMLVIQGKPLFFLGRMVNRILRLASKKKALPDNDSTWRREFEFILKELRRTVGRGGFTGVETIAAIAALIPKEDYPTLRMPEHPSPAQVRLWIHAFDSWFEAIDKTTVILNKKGYRKFKRQPKYQGVRGAERLPRTVEVSKTVTSGNQGVADTLLKYVPLNGRVILLPDGYRVKVVVQKDQVLLYAFESDARGNDFNSLLGIVYADESKQGEKSAIVSRVLGSKLDDFLGANPEKGATPKPKHDPLTAPSTAPKKKASRASAEREKKAKITGWGEQIKGAHKFRFAQIVDVLPLDDGSINLTTHFKEPDYAKAIADGADAQKLAAYKALRDLIPRKPTKRQSYKLRTWGETVRKLHTAMKALVDEDLNAEKFEEILKRYPELHERVEFYRQLGHPAFEHAKEYSVSAYIGKMGLTMQTVAVIKLYKNSRGGRHTLIQAGSAIIPAEELTDEKVVEARNKAVQVAQSLILDDLGEKTGKPAKIPKPTKFVVYRIRGSYAANCYITPKGFPRAHLKDGFGSANEAFAYIQENQDELEKKWAEMKKSPIVRHASNRERVGKQHRQGDATPEMFHGTFGFRGVEFGNWVNNSKRQADLNQAYDAFMDLADVLNIPSAALSLDGSLSLAFGAMGRPRSSATYHPQDVAINLNRDSGAGSLAHEWFHAIDNYFARLSRTGETAPIPLGEYVTNAELHSNREQKAPNLRPEVYEAFRKLNHVFRTVGTFRSRAQSMDAAKKEPYWSKTIEMAARAFEAYAVDQLEKRFSGTNDYLANLDQESGAYPTQEELDGGIRQAFTDIFNTLQTQETEKGTALW